MGEVRQRGQKWWIRYYRNGKRYEESSDSDKKTVARDLLKIREGDIVRGVPVTPKVGRLLFDEAAKYVENDYRKNNKRSLADVISRTNNHLTPFFGGRRMVSITTPEIDTFIVKRQEAHASNAEINRELAILKRAFRLALKAKTLFVMPYICKLDEDNVRTGFFERDQFEAVRAALPPAMRPVTTFAYYTGWRVPSEILTRQWHNIDRLRCVVRLEPGETKNRKGRTFPYGDLPELCEMIEAQWAETKRVEKERGMICPLVFHENGKSFRDGAGDAAKHFRNEWRKACIAAGCPGRILHDFRRTAIRNFTRSGIPEQTAMKLSGHKTRSVFDRYDIINEADLQGAVARLAAATRTENDELGTAGRVKEFRQAAK